MDSNHRRHSQQIYSLPPLATWVTYQNQYQALNDRSNRCFSHHCIPCSLNCHEHKTNDLLCSTRVEKKAPITSLQTANGGHSHRFRTCCNISAAGRFLHEQKSRASRFVRGRAQKSGTRRAALVFFKARHTIKMPDLTRFISLQIQPDAHLGSRKKHGCIGCDDGCLVVHTNNDRHALALTLVRAGAKQHWSPGFDRYIGQPGEEIAGQADIRAAGPIQDHVSIADAAHGQTDVHINSVLSVKSAKHQAKIKSRCSRRPHSCLPLSITRRR